MDGLHARRLQTVTLIVAAMQFVLDTLGGLVHADPVLREMFRVSCRRIPHTACASRATARGWGTQNNLGYPSLQ